MIFQNKQETTILQVHMCSVESKAEFINSTESCPDHAVLLFFINLLGDWLRLLEDASLNVFEIYRFP